MFSKLKKLVGKADDDHGDGSSGGMASSMEPHLQRKFARGIHYNMKIVIRGDKNVGKTSLLQRLQGLNFKDDYVPSEEIQVANIQWNFKTSDEVVKVEIWDVVDKSTKKKTISGLKVSNSVAQEPAGLGEMEQFGLDAETLDVYKGAHGVIMMMDLTKAWTFEYVKREMERVSPHLPVLILVNHRDMGHHQGGSFVTVEQVKGFVTHLHRPQNAAAVLVAESSMRNGFGLKYIHKFFNLPFLQLQREVLEMQLQQNKTDMDTTLDELEVLLESPEQNYESFIELLGDVRRREADKLAPPKNIHGIPHARQASGNSPAVSASSSGVMAPPAHPHQGGNPLLNKTQTPNNNTDNNKTPPPPKTPEKTPEKKKPGFFSFTSKNTTNENNIPTAKAFPVMNSSGRVEKSPVKDINDFVPDDDVAGDFLDDMGHSTSGQLSQGGRGITDSDDDEDDENPMVAGFDDEVELDHFEPVYTEAKVPSVVVSPRVASPSLPSPVGETPTVADVEEEPTIEPAQQSPANSRTAIVNHFDEDLESSQKIKMSNSSLEKSEDIGEASPTIERPRTEMESPVDAPDEDSAITDVKPEDTSALSIIDPDEFSSWLKSVEKREVVQPVRSAGKTSRKYSAGLITATSLDDSRIDSMSLHSPEMEKLPEVREKSKSSKSDKTKKKSSSKKDGDSGEKKTRKKKKDREVAEVVTEEPKEAPLTMRKPVQQNSTKKRLSDADVHETLERELEDFLASEEE